MTCNTKEREEESLNLLRDDDPDPNVWMRLRQPGKRERGSPTTDRSSRVKREEETRERQKETKNIRSQRRAVVIRTFAFSLAGQTWNIRTRVKRFIDTDVH